MRPRSDNPYPPGHPKGPYFMLHALAALLEAWVTRVIAPVVGVAGIGYEELTGHVDPELLLLYGALLGYGGYKNIKLKGGGGDQDNS